MKRLHRQGSTIAYQPLIRNCAALTLLFMTGSVQAFAETLIVRRTLPATTTTDQAYQCALQAWRQNLGLWFVPPPFILDPGEEETGVGFVLMRIPPLGLQEGIVARQQDPDDGSLTMVYKVLNPAPWTWPVSHHQGEISFRRNDQGHEACQLEWTVRWTPLASWIPFFPQTMRAITEFIIEWAASYVVTLCQARNDDKEL